MHKVIQSAIVIASPQNNPSLITPQFLREYDISQPDWKFEGLNIESPSLSQVAWSNGLSLKSEAGRIIFQYDLNKGQHEPNDRKCLLGDIAEKYLIQISKIKYTAVGINFYSIYDDIENIEKEFSSLFLSADLNKIPNITQENVKISRKIDDLKTQNLTIGIGQLLEPVEGNDITKNAVCITFKGNLHCTIKKNKIQDSWGEVMDLIKSWDSFYMYFSTLVNEIINLCNKKN